MEFWQAVLIFISAYLIGSLSSAVIVCRMMGLADPRTTGSRNPGATNVLRIGGKKAAIITLIGDAAKGWLPVFIAHVCSAHSSLIAGVALAAFIGHLFPIFFGFAGGKGVATAFGCLLGMSWPVGLCLLATWIVVALISRYSSLAALITALTAPFYIEWLTHDNALLIVTLLMSAILIYRHKKNVKNLIGGKENKLY